MTDKEKLDKLYITVEMLLDALLRKGGIQDGNWGYPSFHNYSPAMTLPERIRQLIRHHGSLRAAARATRIDHGYLFRLCVGEKKEPSAATLRKLGLRKVVTYKPLDIKQGQP